jgi:hypothetical protein
VKNQARKKVFYEAHEGLYRCYKKRKNYAKALYHHEEFLKVREEVFNEQSDKRISRLAN